MKTKFVQIILFSLLLATIASAQQSGGDFTIEKSVIASGGGTQAGSDFAIENTIGQTVPENVQGGQFTIFGGFITSPLAPTAASVTVSGKVLTPDGRGLINAVVILTDSGGSTRTARTGGFGNYRFDDVEVGQAYIFTVSSRRYNFAPQIVTVLEDLLNLNFVGI